MKSKTIILSIHPNHIEKILSGDKRYEYRKHIPQDINYIIVYATAPTKKVVAIIEIDMVINVGDVKEGNYDTVCEEIKAVKRACGEKTLKVIIETCLLTEQEKINMCKIVTKANADYIKTSTGFSFGGATKEDIKLFSENVGKNVKIKADF